MTIPESELIINPDGSVYHLHLCPGDVADHIITVGDPERVDIVTQHFDEIYLTKTNREFKTVTGRIGSKELTVIATGIGTDNIDIVFNELDALFNIDFNTRQIKDELTSLNFIRIGTSGAVRKDVPIDSIIASHYACGIDGLLHHYNSEVVRELDLEELIEISTSMSPIYATAGDTTLINKFREIASPGITITANGFYGPQSRSLRLQARHDIAKMMSSLTYRDLRITNLEMETAGIYGLSKLLGHKAVSLNAILANRVTGEFSSQASKTVGRLIEKVLEIFSES